MTAASGERRLDVSVVCPFFNESGILEYAVRQLLANLATLDADWELIIVNDGSVDESGAIAERLARESPRLRVLGYAQNRGRGHALRTGIAAARGDVVITTEIDLSWGDQIVHQLLAAMRQSPGTEVVVASPHLLGGGYRNVPFKRVWLSRAGNWVIRALMSNAASMNTGMTRAYQRSFIQSLPLVEDGKEFHLEVILKATAFGARIREIPAILEWKEYKHRGQRVARKSSSRVRRLIKSHTLFSLFANPIRYIWPMSLLSVLVGIGSLAIAVISLYRKVDAVYWALLGVSMVILGILLFVFGVVLQQGNTIQRELWLLQRLLPARTARPDSPESSSNRSIGGP